MPAPTINRMVIMGQPPAWTPAQLGTSLALWLDAADSSTITLNGSNVAAWADKSGKLRHVTQGTAGLQPAYSATGFNGKPCLDITTAQKYLQNVGAGTLTSATISFVGAYGDTTITARPVGYTSANSTPNPRCSFTLAGDGSLRFDGSSSSVVALPAGNIIRIATRSPSLVEDFRNGGSASISEAGPADAIHDRINIGNAITDVSFAIGTFTGKISEVVFLSAIISTADRQKLEGYFAHKGGLQSNLPANHPYKSRRP